MDSPAAPDYFVFSDYLSPLRRRWPIVVVVALLGVALAVGYVVVAPPQYTGTVLVQVNALPDNANAVGGRTGGPVNMDNEAQAVRSGAVASIVKSQLHSSLTLAQISQLIKVTVPPNTTYLQITAAAPTAAGAAKMANTVGRAYLTERRESTKALVGSGIKALRDRSAGLRTTIERLKTVIYSTRHTSKNPSGDPVIVGDELLLSSAQTALSSLQSHIDVAMPLYASLDTPDSVLVGSILTPATIPLSPSSPRKLLVLPSGLLAGLLAGLVLAFVVDRRDKRVHSARDVERLVSVPTLLRLTGSEHGALTAVESPRSKSGRAFAELARHAATALGDGEHVLVVAATAAGSSGSVVAANLAVALARTGSQTALVCGDVHGSTVPLLLGVGRGRGLSDVLAGAAAVSEVAAAVDGVPGLRVLAPGLDPSGMQAAMQYAAVNKAISDLLDGSRYVIIEVQSVGENAETFGLAEFAETAIVAIETGRSRPADITECLQRLDMLGAPVLGTAILPAGPGGRGSRRTTRQDPAAATPEPSAVVSRFLRPADQSARAEPHPVPERPAPEHPAPQPTTWSAEASEPVAWPTRPAKAARASGELPEFTTTFPARRVAETWPMPRVQASEQDLYTDLADPASGD